MLKKTIVLGTVIGTVMALTPALAQEKTKIDLLGARHGAYSYNVMYGAQVIINDHSDKLEGVVQEAFGAADNLKRLHQDAELRKHAFAATTVPAMYSARKGQPVELFPEPITDVLHVFNSANFCTWIAVSDENIKSMEDLAGKKFDAGPYGNFMGSIADSILEAYGVKDKVGTLLHTADQPAQYAAFTDGKVDGILSGSVVTGPDTVRFNGTVQKLLAARKIWPVSLSPEKIKEVSKISGIPFSVCTVKAGVPNPDAPGYSSTQFAGNMVAHKDMDDDLVYEIMKLIIANVEEFGKYADQAKKAMTRESLAAINAPVSDFHPGAVRAYREAGLKVGDENFQ